jgi:hypothetical protein
MARFVTMKFGYLWSLLGLSSACMSISGDVPARLISVDTATMSKIAGIVKQTLGNQNIELGPQALEATTITVLPPPLGPYETRSVAVPEVYDIIKRGSVCLLVRRTTRQEVALTGVTCVPTGPN